MLLSAMFCSHQCLAVALCSLRCANNAVCRLSGEAFAQVGVDVDRQSNHRQCFSGDAIILCCVQTCTVHFHWDKVHSTYVMIFFPFTIEQISLHAEAKGLVTNIVCCCFACIVFLLCLSCFACHKKAWFGQANSTNCALPLQPCARC